MSEDKSVKDYVEKLAEGKLDEVMGGAGKRKWTEDRDGGRWEDDWQRPQYSVRPTMNEWLRDAEANGARVNWRRGRTVEEVGDDMPSFLDRRKPKRQQYGVSVETAEDWAKVVRPQGGVVVLSDFMVTKMTDILMREMCDVLEEGQLIFESEDASRNVRQGLRKIVCEYVQYLDKRTGEYCDVEVE